MSVMTYTLFETYAFHKRTFYSFLLPTRTVDVTCSDVHLHVLIFASADKEQSFIWLSLTR